MIFWGCNINSPEGFRVSETFREHTYPFVGVVGLSSNPGKKSLNFCGRICMLDVLLVYVLSIFEHVLRFSNANGSTRSH